MNRCLTVCMRAHDWVGQVWPTEISSMVRTKSEGILDFRWDVFVINTIKKYSLLGNFCHYFVFFFFVILSKI